MKWIYRRSSAKKAQALFRFVGPRAVMNIGQAFKIKLRIPASKLLYYYWPKIGRCNCNFKWFMSFSTWNKRTKPFLEITWLWIMPRFLQMVALLASSWHLQSSNTSCYWSVRKPEARIFGATINDFTTTAFEANQRKLTHNHYWMGVGDWKNSNMTFVLYLAHILSRRTLNKRLIKSQDFMELLESLLFKTGVHEYKMSEKKEVLNFCRAAQSTQQEL